MWDYQGDAWRRSDNFFVIDRAVSCNTYGVSAATYMARAASHTHATWHITLMQWDLRLDFQLKGVVIDCEHLKYVGPLRLPNASITRHVRAHISEVSKAKVELDWVVPAPDAYEKERRHQAQPELSPWEQRSWTQQ